MFNKVGSLDSFVTIVKVLKAAIPADLSIAVCDMEKFISYFPGKDINLAIRSGQRLNNDEPLSIALKQNRRLEATVPKDFYGFEFVGTATPLHDSTGRVIGGVAVQVRKQSELINISSTISKSLTQVTGQINSIAHGSAMLREASTELLNQSEQAERNVKQTSEILTLMKRMADQTNLLGLNAAIEAARAGEQGKGFEVVATEIRRFSKETVNSTEQIREMLTEINRATEKMARSITQISDVGVSQLDSIEQVSDFVKEIQEMSAQLNDYANKL